MAHTDYLQPIFDKGSRTRAIKYVLKTLENIEYDAIAFSGMSGALMASIIADRTGKGLIMVRKKRDDSHSSFFVESTAYKKDTVKYVIIDDLISSGDTIHRIMEYVSDYSINSEMSKMLCVGVVLYSPTHILNNNIPKAVVGIDNELVPVWCRKFKNNS